MTCTNSLINCVRPLVLDTSVLINLHACTYGVDVLCALPHDIVVPKNVATELEHETSRINGEHGFLKKLAKKKTICITDMNTSEYELFERLINEPHSLDDGEAATIAVATSRELMSVIDEKKGRARALELTPDKNPGLSLDIFRHPKVIEELGETDAINALYLALFEGHMRVPTQRSNEVENLLGIERASKCTSLPDYKNKLKHWITLKNY